MVRKESHFWQRAEETLQPKRPCDLVTIFSLSCIFYLVSSEHVHGTVKRPRTRTVLLLLIKINVHLDTSMFLINTSNIHRSSEWHSFTWNIRAWSFRNTKFITNFVYAHPFLLNHSILPLSRLPPELKLINFAQKIVREQMNPAGWTLPLVLVMVLERDNELGLLGFALN